MSISELEPYDKVFFVHYQCQQFNDGEQIYNMCVGYNNKVKQFDAQPNEAAMIEEYCKLVKNYCDQGIRPIHWNQNAKYFGIDHICSRYKALTGETITLEYPNDIDLSSLLIDMFGDDYVSHPRLDTLATLNNFKGHSSDSNMRIFPTQRTQLLAKIYHKLINKKLITEKQAIGSDQPIVTTAATVNKKGQKPCKSFDDFLIHTQKTKLASALKQEFKTEKGKALRLLIEAMKQMNPPLLTVCYGEAKMLYNAMIVLFCREIGSYNSIFDYKYNEVNDANDVVVMKTRIRFVLDNLK